MGGKTSDRVAAFAREMPKARRGFSMTSDAASRSEGEARPRSTACTQSAFITDNYGLCPRALWQPMLFPSLSPICRMSASCRIDKMIGSGSSAVDSYLVVRNWVCARPYLPIGFMLCARLPRASSGRFCKLDVSHFGSHGGAQSILATVTGLTARRLFRLRTATVREGYHRKPCMWTDRLAYANRQ